MSVEELVPVFFLGVIIAGVLTFRLGKKMAEILEEERKLKRKRFPPSLTVSLLAVAVMLLLSLGFLFRVVSPLALPWMVVVFTGFYMGVLTIQLRGKDPAR